MSDLTFEWDDLKAVSNESKHGVSFEEAATVLNDPRRLQYFDAAHSLDEDRENVIGFSARLRLLMVVIYERENQTIRIISARRANKAEGLRYFNES